MTKFDDAHETNPQYYKLFALETQTIVAPIAGTTQTCGLFNTTQLVPAIVVELLPANIAFGTDPRKN